MGLSRARQRLLRRISTRRGREAEGVVLLEGPRVLTTSLQLGAEILFVAVEREGDGSILSQRTEALLDEAGTEIVELPPGALAEFADTESPQGILAVAREPRSSLPAPRRGGSAKAVGMLVLDGLRDPGNVGTLVRTAAAFGLRRVIALDGTADPWGARAVRASAGLIFGLPVHALRWEDARAWLQEAEIPLIVADPNGRDVREWLPGRGSRLADEWALLVGNETTGPRAPVCEAAVAKLSVPMTPGVDSLSVATAGAVLLWILGPGRELAGGETK